MPAGALAASTHEDELEAEQAKDIWAMSVFGHRGRLDFTAISQPWLREATKRWAIQDLIRRRGDGVTTVLRAHVAALAGLSESLRIHRSDHGLVIGALGRHDIEMFLQRLAYLEHCDEISALSRSLSCRKVHHALRQMRLLGLTRADDPLGGLPDDFGLRREDIPRRPDRQASHRALPPEILAQLCDALPLLRTRTSKVLAVAIELLIDTGRRPSEILNLPWDCLGHDHDDSYVLVYDDLKNNRPGRRLPITHTTAELIRAQQHATREQFPDSNPTELILLPASDQNGRRALARHQIGRTHRDWLKALPGGLTRSTLYRHLPSRPPQTLTADIPQPEARKTPTPVAAPSSPAAGSSSCPTCGHEPATRRDLVPHRADLATIWLHLGDRNELREARHCAHCQPHGHVLVVSCSRCGDGPLVTGTDSGSDDVPASVRAWLTQHDWSVGSDLLCPNHS
ncbi:hypothetical protein [Rhodococcus wratislaviensis]|uniref:hypothetical protein n=1 Tax=Rhodococcus wratislaviensis TaxID=44752 RepID=UPI0036671C4E